MPASRVAATVRTADARSTTARPGLAVALGARSMRVTTDFEDPWH